MTEPHRPLTESYWVVPGLLLAGEYPAGRLGYQTRRRLSALLAHGFDIFIDLTSPGEIEPYKPTLEKEASRLGISARHQRFPVGDFGLPTHEQMKKILDTIDAAIKGGHKVYLHCWGGIGRTGTTVGCYLVRHGKSGAQALNQLAEWWQAVPKSARFPDSPETAAQRQFVLTWK